MARTLDFIVVGAGSASAVIAARLSEAGCYSCAIMICERGANFILEDNR